MRINSHSSLLFLLPLASAGPHHTRSLGDKIEGAFGDPAALARQMPSCMSLCASLMVGLNTHCVVYSSDPNPPQPPPLCSCVYDGGAEWDNATRSCFESNAQPGNGTGGQGDDVLGCEKQKYLDGNIAAICKAIGNSTDKGNKVLDALGNKFDKALNISDPDADKQGKKSSAAAARFVWMGKAGVGVLAAVVGFAVGML
jgi:hypothetical protein